MNVLVNLNTYYILQFENTFMRTVYIPVTTRETI